MQSVKNTWEGLNPKAKRYLAVGAFCLAALAVIGTFSGERKEDQPRGHKETIKNVLTDKSMREVGMDSVAAEIRILVRRMDEAERKLSRKNPDERNERPESDAERSRTQAEIRELKSTVERLLEERKAEPPVATPKPPRAAAGAMGGADPAGDDSHSVFGRGPAGGYGSADGQGPGGEGASVSATAEKSGGLKIASFSQSGKAKDKAAAVKEEDESIYLPAGSILTGALINGMDAPTGQGARRDPFPSTLRLQKEAILPNRFRADVRECFLIVSGYGDLSSERAYLRGETISCVREDGGVIEAKLDSYVVGEDGKAGARGRLVSKQGQIIAKSLMAGFVSAAGEAFNVKQMPVINLSTNGQNLNNSRTQYSDGISSELLQGAGYKGASNALERIAQYYVSMAEGIFPVIEIDAGRQFDVIMTKGVKLQVKGNKGKK